MFSSEVPRTQVSCQFSFQMWKPFFHFSMIMCCIHKLLCSIKTNPINLPHIINSNNQFTFCFSCEHQAPGSELREAGYHIQVTFAKATETPRNRASLTGVY